MKCLLIAFAMLLAVAAALPAIAADVGVSVQVGEPGFYGRIDIGNFPQPQVIYPKPVVIQPVPAGVAPPEPLYLRVPPGHEKNWAKHCREYNACGRPVYFVEHRWYQEQYAPRYRQDHDRDHGEHHAEGRHEEHGYNHEYGNRHRDD